MASRFVLPRRTLLGMTAAAVGSAVLAGCTRHQPSFIPTPNRRPAGAGGTLRVPPILEQTGDGPEAAFELVSGQGSTNMVAAGRTTTWGFNGTYLGPTIRVRRGDQFAVRVTNALTETTTVHWHGMHLPAYADGGPHQPIAPGETWKPTPWRVDQPGATLWYHPHPHGTTEQHVWRGLAGMLIVEDDDTDRLPHEYGIDDIPLIVQDRSFGPDGDFEETDRLGPGMLGDTILVNGIVGASLIVAAARTRLRLLNASTARTYAFGFSDGRSFPVIASDGGLLQSPVEVERVQLSPGERAEIVLTMTAGSAVTLRSFAQDLGDTAGTTGEADDFDILTISAPASLSNPVTAVPARLTTVRPYLPEASTRTRTFALDTDRINDRQMNMQRVDETVPVGRLETWEVVNRNRTPHNFHVHDTQFQIVSIGGSPPAAQFAGWKDTVYLPPNQPIRLLLRFSGYVDPATPYMYHCHMLWHEDLGMMGQFVVVAPGQSPPTGGAAGHRH